jgi:hypothetical protein
MPETKKYTVEIFKPAFSGNTFTPRVFMRVHIGDFEANRDNLSPCMVQALQIAAVNKKNANAIGKRLFDDYITYHSRSAKY